MANSYKLDTDKNKSNLIFDGYVSLLFFVIQLMQIYHLDNILKLFLVNIYELYILINKHYAMGVKIY